MGNLWGLALRSGLPCRACHPLGGCKCRWRLSAPLGDKRLSQAECRLTLAAWGPPRSPPCPARRCMGPDTQAPLFFLLPQGLRIAAGMKLVPVALMYLGSLIFLGVDTARLDVAAEFERSEWLAAPSPVLVPARQGKLTSGRRGLELKRNGNGPRPRQDDCEWSLFVF